MNFLLALLIALLPVPAADLSVTHQPAELIVMQGHEYTYTVTIVHPGVAADVFFDMDGHFEPVQIVGCSATLAHHRTVRSCELEPGSTDPTVLQVTFGVTPGSANHTRIHTEVVGANGRKDAAITNVTVLSPQAFLPLISRNEGVHHD